MSHPTALNAMQTPPVMITSTRVAIGIQIGFGTQNESPACEMIDNRRIS